MKNTIFISHKLLFTPFLLLVVLLVFTCNKEDDSGQQVTCESEVFHADICVTFALNELTITSDASLFYLTNGSDLTLEFEKMSEAEMARDIIEHYNLDQYCIIGSDTAFTYFLAGDQIPTGDIAGEDCSSFELCDLGVEFIDQSQLYTVVEGARLLYTAATEETAKQILETLQYYQASAACYVGRPNTKVHYLRR